MSDGCPPRDGAGHRRRLTPAGLHAKPAAGERASAIGVTRDTAPRDTEQRPSARAETGNTAHRYTRSALVRNQSGGVRLSGVGGRAGDDGGGDDGVDDADDETRRAGIPRASPRRRDVLRARDARAPRILGLPHHPRDSQRKLIRATRVDPRARSAAPNDSTPVASTKSGVSAKDTDEEYDVVVIGSGIGGLSAASLLARYGYSVKLFESHYLAGGCCHMFDHRDKDGGLWRFEVGPSIWEGLDRPTGNPLRMVFDALDETMPARTYDGISMWTPEGHWRFQLGDDDAPGGFCDLLREKATDSELAIKEWKALKGRLEPLYDALDACPLTALRQDAGLLLSTVIAIPFYLTHPKVMLDIPYILDSFHKLSRQYVTEPFLKQWIDMLAFFSGYPAEGTMGATMIYSIPGFHRPGASLCAPTGGTQAVVDKLVGALDKFGGSMELKKHVDEIIVEDGEARGGFARREGRAGETRRRLQRDDLGHRSPPPRPRRTHRSGFTQRRGLEGGHGGDPRARVHHAPIPRHRRDGFAGSRPFAPRRERLVSAVGGSAERGDHLRAHGAGPRGGPTGEAHRARVHRRERAVRPVGGEGPQQPRVQGVQARARKDFVGHD